VYISEGICKTQWLDMKLPLRIICHFKEIPLRLKLGGVLEGEVQRESLRKSQNNNNTLQ